MLIQSTLIADVDRRTLGRMTQQLIEVPAGLNGVVAADTAIGAVDGDRGFFHYGRVRRHDARPRTRSFEDVWFLVREGRLPTGSEAAFRVRRPKRIVRTPPADSDDRDVVPQQHASMLDKLRAGALDCERLRLNPVIDVDDLDSAVSRRCDSRPLVPSMLAALHRVGSGQRSRRVRSRRLGHAAELSVADDRCRSDTGGGRAVEQYMILTIDHGFNASTFTARVVASTGPTRLTRCAQRSEHSPARCTVALPAVHSMHSTRSDRFEAAADWVRGEVAAGRRIMGFGHAVYRAPDPALCAVARRSPNGLGGDLVELATAVEAESPRDARRTQAGSTRCRATSSSMPVS
jgi:citrate synthase